MRSPAFDEAVAALQDAHAYPMLSPEFRAGVQRAYQGFKWVGMFGEDEQDREFADHTADSLLHYLTVDFGAVEDVEVRYPDGTYEILHFKDDAGAREKLRLATTFRAIELDDEEW